MAVDPGVLDHEPRAGDRLARSASATASGCPGSASSRLATTTVGTRDRRAAARAARTGASAAPTSSASATASGCSCAARRWRSTVCDGRAQRLGHVLEVIGARRSPRRRPRAARARARPSAASSASRAARGGVERGRDDRERGDALGVLEREAHGRVRAHRGAGEQRALDARCVEHRREVARRGARSRTRRLGRGRRAAVPARVVGDHAVARALERARAHHDVAAGGGEAVQQHDRGARRRDSSPASVTPSSVATLSSRCPVPAIGALGAQACAAACARSSSAERSGRSQKNRWPTPSRISSCAPGISSAIRRPFCTGSI